MKDRLQFARLVCVEANGRAGGLAMFWHKEVDLSISKMDLHFIDCGIRRTDGVTWRLTEVYGWSENGHKHQT